MSFCLHTQAPHAKGTAQLCTLLQGTLLSVEMYSTPLQMEVIFKTTTLVQMNSCFTSCDSLNLILVKRLSTKTN